MSRDKSVSKKQHHARRAKGNVAIDPSSFDQRLRQRSLNPEPSHAVPEVILTSPIRQPLVYQKRIKKWPTKAADGDLVSVWAPFKIDDERAKEIRLIGFGFFNSKAEIAVRIVSFGPTIPDEEFWNEKVCQAISLRRDLLKLDSQCNTYRVIHAESDGFSGLMVDRYDSIISAEVFSLAMYQRSEALVSLIARQLNCDHYLIRTAPHVLSQEGFDGPDISSPNLPKSVVVHESGTRFQISFDRDAHKTGFFCDQRENRKRLAKYCEGKSVLDLCCYTGGFSVQAKKLGGAAEVIGVDLDQAPLESAKRNANLNQCQIRFVNADIFPYMRDAIREGKLFDIVVLDPPKLIRSRMELEEGRKAHFDMNRLAVRLVRPGGILVTCTCAGLLGNEAFLETVLAACRSSSRETADDSLATAMQRTVIGRIIARTGAGEDHPIGSNCPETEYLHAIWMQVVE
ncbi:MAG: class I SAM-dependent rRNA methyltransferase [Pirellulaceae bacterium]